MSSLRSTLIRTLTSLELTIVLLVLSMVLVLAGTLAQVNYGIWMVQETYFRSFLIYYNIPGTPFSLPVFPGGYTLGLLLLANLAGGHIYRFGLRWSKVGILITHAGIILLLVGELLSGLYQEEFRMQIMKGETKNYSEHPTKHELVFSDVSQPESDEVVAIPESLLKKDQTIQHPKLPFRLVVKEFFPNSSLQMRGRTPNAPASLATTGMGTEIVATGIPLTYKQDERNVPTCFIELIGTEGSLGTFLASPHIEAVQSFSAGARKFTLGMRLAREYKPFSLTLKDLRHDVYAGSDIPRNFSSLVHLKSQDGKEDRDVTIYMNNPLRFGGLTFYQYQMNKDNGYSVLQVVRNPSWLIPYISSGLISFGLLFQFCLSLGGFIRNRGVKVSK